MKIKIVIAGDNHLNAYTSKMRPAQLEERRRRLKENFQKTIDFALKNKIDLYFNVGDLFDMPNPKNDSLVKVAEGIYQLSRAGIRSFLIGGTHDTPKGGGVMPQLIFEPHERVYIFKEQNRIEKVELNIKDIDINIAGITTNPLLGRDINLLSSDSIAFEKKSGINILMLHYGLEGYLHPMANEPIIPLEFFDKSPFNYIFAGHVHSHNDFNRNGRLFIMPGAAEKLTFTEEKEPGFYYLEIEEKKPPVLEFIPLPFQKRKELIIDFNKVDIENPYEYIMNQLEKESDPEQLLKLKLVGYLNRETYQKIKFHNIWRIGLEKNFYFEIDRQNFDILNKIRQLVGHGRLSQREEVNKIAGEMQKDARTNEDKEIIEDARELIIRRFEEMK